MNDGKDDEETDGRKVPFLMRKVSIIPCGIRGILGAVEQLFLQLQNG